jgi:cyclophilin family peptidyl-prolyl cis-trans isomerase
MSRLATAIAAVLLAGWSLSACGSSGGGAGTSSGARTAPATSAQQAGACAAVAAPQAKGRQTVAKPTLRLDPARTYTAKLRTNCGEIDVRLDVRRAPKTTASFVYLARRGFFDGLTFHRVARAPDGTPFVIQGGDPFGDGQGGPGYQIVEPPPTGLQYGHGVVAMAKTQTDPPGASGSQFFIVTGTDAQLPSDYALVGSVSSGDAVAAHIAAAQTDANERPLAPIVIEHVTIATS